MAGRRGEGHEGYANVTLSTNHRLIAIKAAGDDAYYTVYDLSVS